MVQDRPLRRLQRWSGTETELGGEVAPRALVDVKRFRLPAAAIEGQHELPGEALAGGMPGDERCQFGNHRIMAAQDQVGLDAGFERDQTQLLQAPDLRLREV